MGVVVGWYVCGMEEVMYGKIPITDSSFVPARSDSIGSQSSHHVPLMITLIRSSDLTLPTIQTQRALTNPAPKASLIKLVSC